VIILDTDVLGHLQKRDAVGVGIAANLDASADRDVRITVISAYEMLGGAVALIDRRKRERRDPIPAFRLLQELVEYLTAWRGLVLPYEGQAEQVYAGLPSRLRQGLKDGARITAIALTQGATVWTCNVTDFAKVPGLAVVEAPTGTRVA
jgi:predicted nucleic acid-binding protein